MGMDMNQKINAQVRTLRNQIEEAERVIAGIESAAATTARVLSIANDIGVTTVGIGRKHADLGNEQFPFSATGSIFTPLGDRHDGWPAAWHIANKAGIADRVGNTGQHQIPISACIDGLYRCIDGVWTQIDGE